MAASEGMLRMYLYFLGIFFNLGISLKYAYFQNEFQLHYAYGIYSFNKKSVLAVR